MLRRIDRQTSVRRMHHDHTAHHFSSSKLDTTHPRSVCEQSEKGPSIYLHLVVQSISISPILLPKEIAILANNIIISIPLLMQRSQPIKMPSHLQPP